MFTHVRTLKLMHFFADLSLLHKSVDLLFQKDMNDLETLTNSKIKVEKEIKLLKNNKGKFEGKLSELLRKNEDNIYDYDYKL